MKRTPLAALALLVAVVCVGCSDDPEPDFAPPESTSPAPTDPTSTAPSPPALPEIAETHTARGAEELVRFFWQMAEYAEATGDTTGLAALANRRCKPCASGVKYLDEVFSRGGVITGGATEVSALRSHPFEIGDSSGFAVTASVTNTKQSVDFPGDVKDESYPAATIKTRFFVEWVDRHWSVAHWEQL